MLAPADKMRVSELAHSLKLASEAIRNSQITNKAVLVLKAKGHLRSLQKRRLHPSRVEWLSDSHSRIFDAAALAIEQQMHGHLGEFKSLFVRKLQATDPILVEIAMKKDKH